MAVLTKSVALDHDGDPRILKYPGIADDFFAGAQVFRDANGRATPVPAAGLRHLGTVAKERKSSALDDLIEVQTGGRVRVTGLTIAAGDVCKRVFANVAAASDNPSDLRPDSAAAIGDIPVGTLDRLESSTVGWIDLERKAEEALKA